jgi:uncharacterized protein (DUF1501 family)
MPSSSRFSRRQALRTLALSAAGCSVSRFLPAFAADLAADPARRRHCILLWMTGGPSQIDTFDMKPGHANGGPFKEIATAVPGMRFSEHLPQLAKHAGSLAILRGLSTKEGDHQRATELMHTGHLPMGPIRYPTVGSALSKALARGESDLPSFVSVNPFVPYNVGSPGFLGAAHAPLTVGAQANYVNQQPTPTDGYATLTVDDAQPRPTYLARQQTRLELWRGLENRFLEEHPHAAAAAAHRTVYERAIRFMTGSERALEAFDLSQEPDALRQAYGRGSFGQGCLLARRLVERGVAFVEVAMSSDGNNLVWDTHQDNFNQVQNLSAKLDAGFATLLADLKQRGLLESTTILWMGEFGRTPAITAGTTGREHFTDAWSAVLAGGGIQGGAVHGRTSGDGRTVEDGRIEVGDLLATVAAAVGVKPDSENLSEMGRPIKIAEGKPVTAILA